MEIDKSIGCWDEIFATELDDIAYSLMIKKGNYVNHSGDKIKHINQDTFIRWKTLVQISIYYEKAKLILRYEKINKIINRIK